MMLVMEEFITEKCVMMGNHLEERYRHSSMSLLMSEHSWEEIK